MVDSTVSSIDHPDVELHAKLSVPRILTVFSKCISHTFQKLDQSDDHSCAIVNLPFFGEFSRIKDQDRDQYSYSPSKYMQLQTGVEATAQPKMSKVLRKELNL